MPPVKLSSGCLEFPGGFIVYKTQPILLNVNNVLLTFQKAIKDSRQHLRGSLVGTSKVYENDEVELLYYPDQVMTWRDLEGVSQKLRLYVDRVTNFRIFDKQWEQIGKGIVGFV